MNPKFALLVDTTEELLQAVVATAPISLFAFDHTDAITLSEGKALSRTSGSNPGQLTRAGSGRTKWWAGGATFSFCIPTTPPKEIDPRFVSGAGPADADIGGRTDTKVSLQNDTMIAFTRRVPHPYLMGAAKKGPHWRTSLNRVVNAFPGLV